MKKIGKKQDEILRYISEATERQGYPPSVREICKAVGLKSPSSVHTHLKVLSGAGYISKDDRKTRAINVTSYQHIRGKVPLVGAVAAGAPILAVEDVEDYIPFEIDSAGDYFALRIRGDSMVGVGILEGDIIIVRKQQSARNGEIVVAMIGDEATVKTLRLEDGGVFLYPENPRYEPIDGSECAIIGAVRGLVRNY